MLHTRSGPPRQSARPRADLPVRVSRGVGIPEHNLVEIDSLGLRAPVAIDAKARLCVTERYAIAVGAIFPIGHGSLVGAAVCAIEPDIDATTGFVSGIEAHLHRGSSYPAGGRAGRSGRASPPAAGRRVRRRPPTRRSARAGRAAAPPS